MKSILLALVLTSLALWAQTPGATGDNTATNRDEILRQALRQAVAGQTNLPASIPVTPPAETPAAPIVVPPPEQTLAATNRITLPSRIVPASPTDTNAAGTRVVVPINPLVTNATPVVVVPPNPLAPGAAVPNPAARLPNPAAAAPIVPGGTVIGTSTTAQPGTNAASAANASPDDIIPAGVINFAAVDIQEVLKIYAELVNRTILRPTQLPGVITLKTQTALTKNEAIQALKAVLAMNGVSVIEIGDKFAKVVPTAQAPAAGAAFDERKASEFPELGSYVTHVVQLKFVKPTEMVQVLTPFGSGTPQNLLPIDPSQILVIRDYTENVKRMLEMIEKIDVAVPAEYESAVIPIKYALAADIASALNSLSAGGGGSSIGGGTTGGGQRTTTGSRFGGTGIGSNRYGGGYGTGGYPGQTGFQGTMNQPGGAFGTTTPAPGQTGGTFQDRLRNIISRAGGAAAGEIQILGQTKMIADERTNSLLIFASKADMEMIKKIISQLDVVLAQVLIETVIIEVTLGPDTKNFGFSYLQHPQSVGNWNSVGTGGAGQFLNPSSFLGLGTNAAQGFSPGFNYLFSYNQDLDIAVQAVEANSRAKVLQRPRIQTSHAVNATIFVGESRPYPSGSYYGGASFGGYAQIQQLQIGVTLDVTPLINPDGLVVMDIHQTIENYAGFTDITGVGQVPITTRKEAAAKVAVRDRDIIMLGGLIETDKSKSGSGIPWLMDIPLLGYLFKSTATSETRKELIVLIRPTVLPTPEIAALTAKAEKDRMPGVHQTEKEIEDEQAARAKQGEKPYKN